MSSIRYGVDVRRRSIALLLDSRLSHVQIAHEIGCTVGTLHVWQETKVPIVFSRLACTIIPCLEKDVGISPHSGMGVKNGQYQTRRHYYFQSGGHLDQ